MIISIIHANLVRSFERSSIMMQLKRFLKPNIAPMRYLNIAHHFRHREVRPMKLKMKTYSVGATEWLHILVWTIRDPFTIHFSSSLWIGFELIRWKAVFSAEFLSLVRRIKIFESFVHHKVFAAFLDLRRQRCQLMNVCHRQLELLSARAIVCFQCLRQINQIKYALRRSAAIDTNQRRLAVKRQSILVAIKHFNEGQVIVQ
mmetsp:Transcript_11368/g.17245  ORF Transcript_11368/g.17245 Transcript_11368/m.17245 type:complete len:202 (-) Transcript_11368:254-859(-)